MHSYTCIHGNITDQSTSISSNRAPNRQEHLLVDIIKIKIKHNLNFILTVITKQDSQINRNIH